MEKVEFLEEIIKITKSTAKPNENPMAFIKTGEGQMIACLFAVPKPQMKVALYTMMKMHQAKEIILSFDAYAVRTTPDSYEEDSKIQPSQNPKKENCFVISYFSADKTLCYSLFYKIEDGKCVWTEEVNYNDMAQYQSAFNPFKMTREQVDEMMVQIEIEEIKTKGKKKVTELPLGFHIDVYTYKKKAIFEIFNKEQQFGGSKPMPNDKKFKDTMKEATAMLKAVGAQIEKG